MTALAKPGSLQATGAAALAHWLTVGVLALVLVLLLLAQPLGLSAYLVNATGQIMAFALLALALDLIWGYAGILSLGHGLFFAFGGYLVAMHLLAETHALTGVLPDFMQFMGWTSFPAFWWGFERPLYALLLILVLPTALAALVGYVAFRSRVGGVYFAILTQALTYTAMLLMFRNDTGFGGNNGMTGFGYVLGRPINTPGVTIGLAAASAAAVLLAYLALRAFFGTRTGRAVIAARDDEQRLRLLGYRTLRLKVGLFAVSGGLAALAGMLYVPQVGIINPRLLSPELSLEIAVWVAIGGRGSLSGAILGAALVNLLKFWLSGWVPELWPFVLAGAVVLVTLAFPDGLIELLRKRR